MFLITLLAAACGGSALGKDKENDYAPDTFPDGGLGRVEGWKLRRDSGVGAPTVEAGTDASLDSSRTPRAEVGPIAVAVEEANVNNGNRSNSGSKITYRALTARWADLSCDYIFEDGQTSYSSSPSYWPFAAAKEYLHTLSDCRYRLAPYLELSVFTTAKLDSAAPYDAALYNACLDRWALSRSRKYVYSVATVPAQIQECKEVVRDSDFVRLIMADFPTYEHLELQY